MEHYLISLLIFIPLIVALAGIFIPVSQSHLLKPLTLVVTIVQNIVIAFICLNFEPGKGVQFSEQQSWIQLPLGSWGVLKAEYFVGIDGLSLPLVLLSGIVLLITVISSWTIDRNVKGYFLL